METPITVIPLDDRAHVRPQVLWAGQGLWGQADPVPVPALPLISSVTLAKFLSISEPQFPHLPNEASSLEKAFDTCVAPRGPSPAHVGLWSLELAPKTCEEAVSRALKSVPSRR